jgi:hypothetical protein
MASIPLSEYEDQIKINLVIAEKHPLIGYGSKNMLMTGYKTRYSPAQYKKLDVEHDPPVMFTSVHNKGHANIVTQPFGFHCTTTCLNNTIGSSA